ncbi:M48 family metalloprotease [Psychrobacter sp. 72-O-c]|uniref:M48 family metalloprotease n=1 Tax=Psychrobacter sp. 72-O-c TaxID=2774125 RepID=UPI00191AE4BA|nr:M48 family metalloprotease [Psychrobacter sp. 72-O-c]
MDFFGEQRTRTWRSLLLYGLFLLIVLAHMAVALGVMALLLTLFIGGIYYWVLVLVIIWTLFSFMVGSYLEYRRLKAGGRAIAKRVGAVRLFIDSSQEALEYSQGVAHQHTPVSPVRYTSRHIAVRDERDFPPVYRRYYEFAQQLAIASGLSMPILYVMPNEQGINGFVAGRHTQDMVLVVTQGALDKLPDEALYGLIGHEYGHIMHGDAKFNLQLMVVLAGLQILYDWSDPIENLTSGHSRHSSYFDSMTSRQASVAQREIDSQARNTELKTADFTTHAEWVSYWQTQTQLQHSSAKSQSMWLQNKSALNRNAPRSVWTLLLHGLSFSSMASAQLIKHSFNRERELLADATSIQLTRSPAILETLKAIHQDSLGSRLSGIADINGLSHFFFASSGADLGDVSWFATHPSLPERMSAINASEYQNFAIKMAKEQQLNQQKIKEIYDQRRSGTWGELKGNNSLSKNLNSNSPSLSDMYQEKSISVDNVSSNGFDSKVDPDTGLEFSIKEDTIVDGRLQVVASAIGTHKLLKPWQTELSPDLPTDTLISDTDIQNVSLPHYVLDHSHHPLGAQALIEAVLLCHQGHTLSTTAVYDLADIWCGPCQAITAIDHNANDDSSYVNHTNHLEPISTNNPSALNSENPSSKEKGVLPHTIDYKLLETIAGLDRRLDSTLLALAVKRLSKHDLSVTTIEQLHQRSLSSHTHTSQQHYQQQKNCRTMLVRYQQGLFELFKGQMSADLTKNLNDADSETLAQYLPSKPQQSPILSLWQALHLQQLLPVLSQVLGDDGSTENALYQQVLQAGVSDIIAQLDPSGQTFTGLDTNQQAMLVILAYRLAKDTVVKDKVGQTAGFIDNQLFIDNHKCYVIDLRRHARLIDIDLKTVSDANLQWLLLTAQHLNSIQLLAIITLIPTTDENQHKTQQDRGQIAYNGDSHNCFNHNNYRLWLSTLHTVMLHDTIVSQDEFDCLTVLAERWLGVRQLFD